MPQRHASLAVASVALLTPSAQAEDHPVAKIITMLEGLHSKVEGEAQEEALTYEKFEYWCGNSQKSLAKTILEEKKTLERLADEIDSHEQNIEVLTSAIDKLDAELTALSKQGMKSQVARDDAAKLYTEETTSLKGTVTAIEQAITALQTAETDTSKLLLSQKRVQSVLVLLTMDISSEQLSALQNFANDNPDRERPELKAKGDYGSHVDKYAFKSSSVIELLKKLQTKFENELLEMNKGETNALNAHELVKAAHQDLLTAAGGSKSAKETEKTSAEGDLGIAKQAESDTQGDLDADDATLKNTRKSCRVKKTEWEERSATRKGEMEAIKAAIGILSKATGVRTDAPSNPVPPASPVDAPALALAFLQLAKGNPSILKAVELLRKEAQIAHSGVMDKLAQQVASLDDPTKRIKHGDQHFDQVVNAIQKMIFRLQNEQTEEDNHKNWCDKELSKTNASIVDKADKLGELRVKIDEASARVTLLTTDIEAAADMVSEIVAHMRAATQIRKLGKKENAVAIKDAQKAQKALANAVAVLKDFYKSSGEVPKESWEFLQRAPVTLSDTPSTWDASYTGVADPGAQPGGIITVLETVAGDFAKMQSETEAQEESDSNMYEEDIQNCEIEKARRAKESEMKALEKKRLLEKLQSLDKKHKGVTKEHEATEQYEDDLQKACVDGSSTYEDRKAARDGEITALKEAQDILQTAFDDATAPPTKPPPAPEFLEIRRH